MKGFKNEKALIEAQKKYQENKRTPGIMDKIIRLEQELYAEGADQADITLIKMKAR